MPQNSSRQTPRRKQSRAGFYDIYGERIPFIKIIGLCFAAGFVLAILTVAFVGNVSLAVKLGLALSIAPIVIFWSMRFMLWVLDAIYNLLYDKLRPVRRKIRNFRYRNHR